MSLVKVDSQRRIYIPKKTGFDADNAIIVSYGCSFLLIPVQEKAVEIDVKVSIWESKRKAEERAMRERNDAGSGSVLRPDPLCIYRFNMGLRHVSP